MFQQTHSSRHIRHGVMYLPAMEGDLSEDIRMRLGLCLMVLANLTIIAIFFHWNRATGSFVLCTLLMDI